MKNQIEVSDDDDGPGGHEYASIASIFLDPDFPDDPIEQFPEQLEDDESEHDPDVPFPHGDPDGNDRLERFGRILAGPKAPPAALQKAKAEVLQGVQLDPEPSLYETMYSSGLLPGLVHVEPMPTTVQTKPQATCPVPRPSATHVPVRRNAKFRKARKPAVLPVRLVSASELKEQCEALAPAGSHLLVLCGAGKVAKLASDSGTE
eukprot:s418_g29.t1